MINLVDLKVKFLHFELISSDEKVFTELCDRILMHPSFPVAIFGHDLHMTVGLEHNKLEDLAIIIRNLKVDVIER